MQLGKQAFLLEEVISAHDDPSGWTGFTSFTNLVEEAKTVKLGNAKPGPAAVWLTDDL